jgi:lipoate-protein ligase A
MYCLRLSTTDPALNLATEEYLLKYSDLDFFILWVNDPSIIVGKHQNAYSEINYHYIKNRNIPLFRRISGGGAVYHDLGNLNFSFIINRPGQHLLNYQEMLAPIINALNESGINAEFDGRNGLIVNGDKISGCAQHMYKKRLLHHGTLLFNADLTTLNAALRKNKAYSDKSIASVSSRVTNICNHLSGENNINIFMDLLTLHVKNHYSSLNEGVKIEDHGLIQKMMEEKYLQWMWNFGKSPDYTLNTQMSYKENNIYITFSVHKGIIQTMQIKEKQLSGLSESAFALVDVEHEEAAIRSICNQRGLESELCDLFIKNIF